MKFFHFFSLFILFFNSFAKAEDCNAELSKYFSHSANQSKIKEYMRLKAEVAFHRTAHALFYDNAKGIDKNNTKFKESVIRAINKLDQKTKDDPAFKIARQSFEELPLSRRNFAEILPFVINILNSNMKLNEDERDTYNLDDNDLKIFHLLAVAEGNKATKINIKQRIETNDIRNILNFPFQINYILENGHNSDEFDSIKLRNRLSSSIKKANEIIQTLEISTKCKELCGIDYSNPMAHINLINLADHFMKVNAIDRIRLGNIYIETGKKNINRTDFTVNQGQSSTTSQRDKNIATPSAQKSINTPTASKNSGLQKKPIPKQPTEQPSDLTPNQGASITFLANKVLRNFSYFFSAEELINDPNLTRAIAYAIDAKNDKFYYNGKAYFLPSLEESNSHQTAVEIIAENTYFSSTFYNDKIADKNETRKYALSLSPEVQQHKSSLNTNQPNCSTNKDGTHNDEVETMLALALFEAKKESSSSQKKRSFVFNNNHCDSKTGRVIPATKEGFLTHLRGDWKNQSTIPPLTFSKEQKNLMEEAASLDENSYIYDGNLYYISGFSPPYFEHITGNKNASLQIMKAEKAGNKIAKSGNEVYQKGADKKWHRLSDSEIDSELKGKIIGEVDLNTLSPELKKSAVVALLSKKPTFIYNNIIYSSTRLEPEQDLAFKSTSIKPNTIIYGPRDDVKAKSSNENTIHEFHKKYGNKNCEFYTIVDKPAKEIKTFNNSGNLIWNHEVLTGKIKSDKRIQWVDKNNNKTNQITPAGIFTLGERKVSSNYGSYYEKTYEGNLIDLVPENGSSYGDSSSNPFAIHQIPPFLKSRRLPLFNNGNLLDNRETGGCINLPKEDMIYFQEKFHKPGCPFYVLPEEDHLTYEIDKGRKKLSIITKTPENICELTSTNGCSNDYLLSPIAAALKSIPSNPIQIQINHNIYSGINTTWYSVINFQNDYKFPLETFAASIEVNKEKIMSHYKITNEEFNELAKMAIGVMGIESEFGLHEKYILKEFPALNRSLWPDDVSEKTIRDYSPDGQDVVNLGKLVLNDSKDPANSRGPTQIKNVNRFLPPGVVIPEDELINPAKAGEATMHVLINLYAELKQMDRSNKLNVPIVYPNDGNREPNISEYLYYLYNGDKASLEKGTATPDLSIKIKKMKSYMSYIDVKQFEKN